MPDTAASLAECSGPALQREHPFHGLIQADLAVGSQVEQLVHPPDPGYHSTLQAAVVLEVIEQPLLQATDQRVVIRCGPPQEAAGQDALSGGGRGKEQGESFYPLRYRGLIQKDLIEAG